MRVKVGISASPGDHAPRRLIESVAEHGADPLSREDDGRSPVPRAQNPDRLRSVDDPEIARTQAILAIVIDQRTTAILHQVD